jgi:GT2 family glycosyltransferase
VGGEYRFGVGGGRGSGEKDEGQYDKNSRIDFAASAAFMIDRAFFGELGGYDEWFKYYYEDVDLTLRAKSKGGESWYCFRARVYHKGSLTIRKQALSEDLLFCVRRNMVWIVFNNFEGKELVFRLGLIWIFLFLMTARDLLTLKFSRVMVSLRSQKAVFEKLKKTQPWIKSQV